MVADAAAAALLVSHVHWGGGTPTIVDPADFAAVMARIAERFDIRSDAEIAVEVDPRTLTPAMAAALAGAGVNRASLGIQDFNPRVQAAINRVQSFAQTQDVVSMLRDLGIRGINRDLMYGLPFQGLDEVLATVDRTLELGPDRISLFGYAHVTWMKTHQKMIDVAALPDGPARWHQAETAAERLTGAGYRRIGFDHFARPGDPLALALEAGKLRRNFQGYTDDAADTLIGFGASSIGSLPAGYVQNVSGLGEWRRAVEAGRFAAVRGRALDADDRMRRDLINRLICDMTVDLDGFRDLPSAPSDGFAGALD
ncbi:MAG: radical SAM protein, partial [Rhodospirillaceae bacterium]